MNLCHTHIYRVSRGTLRRAATDLLIWNRVRAGTPEERARGNNTGAGAYVSRNELLRLDRRFFVSSREPGVIIAAFIKENNNFAKVTPSICEFRIHRAFQFAWYPPVDLRRFFLPGVSHKLLSTQAVSVWRHARRRSEFLCVNYHGRNWRLDYVRRTCHREYTYKRGSGSRANLLSAD